MAKIQPPAPPSPAAKVIPVPIERMMKVNSQIQPGAPTPNSGQVAPGATPSQNPSAPAPAGVSGPLTDDELFGTLAAPGEEDLDLGTDDNDGQPALPGDPSAQPSGQQPGPDPNAVTPPQAPAKPPTPEEQAAQRQQLYDTAMTELETKVYGLDEATSQLLLTEPGKVLPKLAARLHLQVAQNVAQQIPQLVNQLVSRQLEGRLAAQKAESSFFGQYPALNKPEYGQVVLESLKTIRTMKPNATRAEIEKEGAALAAYRLQLASPTQAQQQQRPAGPPARPAAPQRGAPFSPAQPGGGVPNPGAQQLPPGQTDWGEAVKGDWW